MRVSLKKIESTIREYLDEKGLQNRLINPEIVKIIQTEFVDGTWDYYKSGVGFATVEDFITEGYEEHLCDCEHDDHEIFNDEEDQYNGQGDYIGSYKYQYAVCNYCGKSSPLHTEESEDGPETVYGDWE